jgi:hypothetical protein
MNKPLKCPHPELQFGSGCFYVICQACGQFWVAVKFAEGHMGKPEQEEKEIDYDQGSNCNRQLYRPVGDT